MFVFSTRELLSTSRSTHIDRLSSPLNQCPPPLSLASSPAQLMLAYERSMPNFPSINSIMCLSDSRIVQSASYSRRRFQRVGRLSDLLILRFRRDGHRSSSPTGLLVAFAATVAFLVLLAASTSPVAFLVFI